MTAQDDRAAEVAVLALGLSPRGLDEVMALGVDADLFALPAHRALWLAMAEDRARGWGPDRASILGRWDAQGGTWPPFGGLSDVAAVIAAIEVASVARGRAADYVEALAERRARGAIRAALQDALAAADDGEDSLGLMARARVAVEAGAVRRRGAEYPDLRGLVDQDFARRLAVMDGAAPDTVLTTGLRSLDAVAQIRPGHYVVVAGRPGAGKTHLLLTLARGISAGAGRPVLFVSVEMSDAALAYRAASSEPVAGDARWDVEAARASAWDRWAEPHVLVDSRSSTLSAVLSSIRVAVQRHGICAAVVDYLQLVRGPRLGGHDNREQVVAHMSRELCLAGKGLGVAMIAAAQLNRESEKRADGRPRLADLRESGAIEQDADLVLGIWREAMANPKTTTPDLAEIGVLKQRHGPTGRVQVYYRPGRGYFANLERREP